LLFYFIPHPSLFSVSKCNSTKIIKNYQKFITVEDTCFKKGIYANAIKKMQIPKPKKNSTAYWTCLYFAEPGTLETFLRDYRQILTSQFQNIRIEGGGEY